MGMVARISAILDQGGMVEGQNRRDSTGRQRVREALEEQGRHVVTLFECELVPSNLEGPPELIRGHSSMTAPSGGSFLRAGNPKKPVI